MSRTVTLAELETRVRWQANAVGATLRHTSERIRVEINESIQRFRWFVTRAGNPFYLATFGTTIAAGSSSVIDGITPPWRTVALSALTVAVHDVLLLEQSGGEFRKLDAVSLDGSTVYGTQAGVPQAWTALDPVTIAIFPPPDRAYSALIRFLPQASLLENDADTFDGHAGWEVWIVWDVLHKLVHRDSKPELIASIAAERDRIEAEIKAETSRFQRSAPRRRLDTRGRRQWAARRDTWGRYGY